MATGGRHGPGQSAADEPAVTEPLTLTDPDGAVTRVAPWSSWTREQTRAPGGDPALVTRLDQGQLWFSAGRSRSPWRHEILVGPATVSTQRGRFHVTAEDDGGATVDCLAGRTRVVTALREPLLLGPDQSAAVSADGRTLVVMDRADAADQVLFQDRPREDPLADGPESDDEGSVPAAEPGITTPTAAPGASPRRPGSPRRIAEVIAVLALLAVLLAAVVVFGGDDESGGSDRRPAPSQVTRTTTTRSRPSQTTEPVSTTVPITAPIQDAPSGRATGELVTCRRSPGGVAAEVAVTHKAGDPAAFRVEVGLIDDAGRVYARGVAETPELAAGASRTVRVPVEASGPVTGSCELVSIAPA